MLERLFSSDRPPNRVFYGFIPLHEGRNVALPLWLKALSLYSRRGHVATPYCTLGRDGALERHPPAQYPHWPLREQLAGVGILEFEWVNLLGAYRQSYARRVTQLLIREMNELSRRHGARLTVVLLKSNRDAKAAYLDFLRKNDIDFIYCIYCARPGGRRFRVPGEGHPNGRMNSLWADCIADGFARSTVSRIP